MKNTSSGVRKINHVIKGLLIILKLSTVYNDAVLVMSATCFSSMKNIYRVLSVPGEGLGAVTIEVMC